jgi:hypothetical protein
MNNPARDPVRTACTFARAMDINRANRGRPQGHLHGLNFVLLGEPFYIGNMVNPVNHQHEGGVYSNRRTFLGVIFAAGG